MVRLLYKTTSFQSPQIQIGKTCCLWCGRQSTIYQTAGGHGSGQRNWTKRWCLEWTGYMLGTLHFHPFSIFIHFVSYVFIVHISWFPELHTLRCLDEADSGAGPGSRTRDLANQKHLSARCEDHTPMARTWCLAEPWLRYVAFALNHTTYVVRFSSGFNFRVFWKHFDGLFDWTS